MKPTQDTQLTKKHEFQRSEHAIGVSKTRVVDEDLRILVHRRATHILSQVTRIQSRLKTRRDRLVFQYIIDNTIGRCKATDQIANSQFIQGKRRKKTGEVIDLGCGLKSLKPVREARKSLVQQGVIFEESVTDEYGARSANRYGLVFIRDLLALHGQKKKVKSLEKHTRRGYYKIPTTTQSPKGINTQRCRTTWNISQKRMKRYEMLSERVEYYADLIVEATGDKKSRGAFCQIALTVPEGRIMELLAILKDRTNIKNKGAWFWTVANQYRGRRIIKADRPTESEPPELREDREQVIPSSVSFKKLLAQKRPQLAELFSVNKKLSIPSTHHKFIVGA